jgi:hypothetical protein
MALRTKTFQQFPWIGGVNSSLDPATIPPNQLVQADHAVFGTRGSRKKRPGIDHDWDGETDGTDSIVGGIDLWLGSTSRVQYQFVVTSGKKAYSYSSSTRSADLFAGTAWASAVTSATFETLNNLCIIAVDGTGNVMKKWSGTGSIADLGGTPPVASICRKHLGRLWANDKTNPDRLHYSETGNPEIWGGTGDSGALDIGIGDGDPSGITAIFPTFKGALFVAKRTKLYKVTGQTPEDFDVEEVTNGLGCVSHNSVTAIDENDLVFVSDRGVHSLVTTASFGDFEGKFLSKDIQATFNDSFLKARLPYTWGAYLSHLNSVAFTFTDTNYGSGANNSIWLYNFQQNAWYPWPNISCQSMWLARDSDKWRFYLGTATERVSQTIVSANYDTTSTGAQAAIPFVIKTGVIFVDDSPYTIKGFKKFFLIYKPRGSHTVTATLKIDNFPVQSLAFSQTSSGDTLGFTFVLGTSTLGSALVLAPYTYSIDGYGRGIQLTLAQSGIDEEVEIQGFGFEYSTAGTQQEVIT